MMKKDYQLIADAILATQDRIEGDSTLALRPVERQDQLRGVRRTAAHLADAFASRNPRFDRTRFLKACGYGASKEGPTPWTETMGSDPAAEMARKLEEGTEA